ncbi:SPOR domain-containing protein [Vogesella indigofera]|uniref:SPOR domain-containing protein n=1 Tax=Vogesella indigofera TaxID=45465 RepID=A0ABT5I8C7_VOGIN|nr:SPOR domain-containing protein [Vogesella indigofera]MDC7692140.1 SPOR domain-containing protein [Vogesella indigofera]
MNPTPQERAPGGDSGLSPQIKKRIAIASGLVLVALAAIPIIDSFNPPATPPTPASTPISSGRIIQKDSSDSASLSLSAIDSSAPLEASAAVSASAPAGSSPLAPAPGSPAGVTPLTPPQIQAPPPRTPAVASSKALPDSAAKSSSTTAAPPRRDRTVPAPGVIAAPAPAPAPAIRVPLANTPPTALPRLPAPGIAPQGSSFGYQVQLGLFSSPDNAEKLVADLKKRGITARTETRVQLGPFRTRAEAEEAMQRLRALGYQPLLIPAGQR